ncbi:MAG: transporter [Cycloclasticus sp.]
MNFYKALSVPLVFCSHFALADHPTVAFGLESAGPINTISGTTAPEGVFAVGLRTEILNNDRFTTSELEAYGAAGLEGVHSVDEIRNTSLSAAFGVTEDLTLSARLPYIERKNIRESEEHEQGEGEAHTHGDSSGFGDLLLMGSYRFFNSNDTDASILVGVKAPTGETREKDNDGVRFEAEFQPGTGSWDFLLGAAISHTKGPVGYHANLLYNKTSEGAQHTEVGDAFSYNVAMTYRLPGHDHASHEHDHTDTSNEIKWDISLEANGETRRENRIYGHLEENSGGTTVYLSPGIKVSAGNFGGFISIGVPIIENTKGIQTDVDNRIVAGLSFAL